jgi:hypothetical protein
MELDIAVDNEFGAAITSNAASARVDVFWPNSRQSNVALRIDIAANTGFGMTCPLMAYQ